MKKENAHLNTAENTSEKTFTAENTSENSLENDSIVCNRKLLPHFSFPQHRPALYLLKSQ